MIYTKQVKYTVEYYIEILGFTCDGYTEDWTWASLSRNEVGIMVSYPTLHVPFEKPQFTGSLYFSVDNVDELWNQFKEITIPGYAIETFDYGMREFAIYDNNGYLLQFGQPV
ncbi:bleomycin resistance family protein [Mucilaginibacter xinganensis]|uniref:Bleomycin resistance family protein n=1 Tax=Mucilaginibacter xinganensis TaxID=1234841 RepID=A0A223NYN8_9SPHI|nr:bleomycin resistance family protein [Mucilaginibacter xinganensis]